MGEITKIKCPFCDHELWVHAQVDTVYIQAEPKEWNIHQTRLRSSTADQISESRRVRSGNT